jgi:16S rRNA (guanine1516-N2)-methyltransferase
MAGPGTRDRNAPPAPADPSAHHPARATVAVLADPDHDTSLLKVAARLAVDLRLHFIEPGQPTPATDMLLAVTPRRLEIRIVGDRGNPVWVNLESIDVKSPAGRSLRQPLARALGIRRRADPPPVVIDATAGWGEDSWLMAALGCPVLAVERNRVVATLLRDGLFRAGAAAPDMLQRIHVVNTDARDLLRRLARRTDLHDLPPSVEPFTHPDVVYIDPMFPAPPGGRKAAERKPMAVLRRLVGGDDDAAELLEWALRVARRRVVVKRPLRAQPLADNVVSSHEGKGMRYDVHLVPPRVS